MLTNTKSRTNAISQSQIALINERVHQNQGLLKHLKASQASQQHSSKPELSSMRPNEVDDDWSIVKSLSQLSMPPMTEPPEDVCDDLVFPEMDSRCGEVTKAHKDTFEWIFTSKHTDHKWENFHSWLQSGDGIYWISGKPGAGKSTLMRFLLEDPRTKTGLQTWAQGSLTILSFFFWKPSPAPLQRTVQGLCRALIYQLLQRHQSYKADANDLLGMPSGKSPVRILSNDKLVLCLGRILTSITENRNERVCIFIDGLDEVDAGDQDSLVGLLQTMSRICQLKLCISSRLEARFSQAFSACPRYVQRLLQNPFSLFSVMHPGIKRL